MAEATRNLNADAESPVDTYSAFVMANLAAGILIYPCLSLAAIWIFWSNDAGFAATLAVATSLHLIFFWSGMAHYRRESQFLIPWLIVMACVFLYHRHTDGQPDNGPFSDGIGTVSQQIWGLNGWYRVFDDPVGQFGPSHLDWAAVFLGVELSMIVTTIIVVPAVAGFSRLRGAVNRAVHDRENHNTSR